MAGLILSSVNSRKKELTVLIKNELDPDTRELLDSLFVQRTSPSDSESTPARTTAYQLILLKKLSQSTKPLEVKERVADLDLLAGLYDRLGPAIKVLELSHDGIQYYANSVIKSGIFQITRRTEEDRYLHAIAFVVHQYYRLQDNLIDVLLISV